MNKVQTDNSYFNEKINLRLNNLPSKDEINVLDCFAGNSKIWNNIKKKTDKIINVLSIEKEYKKNNINCLYGDNLKFLKTIDLSEFDIIDLDAYGIPYKQLDLIFKRKYKGLVFITAIQTMTGRLPNNMLIELGYNKEMIKKIPTLFSKNGLEKIKNYLYLHEIKSIKGYFINRKNYFLIKIK